jgi:hypothetical protein
MEAWPRAKLYAQMLGFLHMSESFRSPHRNPSDSHLPPRLNDGCFAENEEPPMDIYTVEFLLQTFSLLRQHRKKLLESKEGYTYIPLFIEERTSPKVLPFIAPADLASTWIPKVGKLAKRIKTTALDETDVDYIDFDLLLTFYLEEYRNFRRSHYKQLQKIFLTITQQQSIKQDFSV